MLKRIPSAKLRVGMHLHELCGPWMEHPFWRSKFVLKDNADVRAVQNSGIAECVIDVSKGLDVLEPEPPSIHQPASAPRQQPSAITSSRQADPSGPTTQPPPPSLADEATRAASLVVDSKRMVVSLFEDARMGRALDTEGCSELVHEVTSSVWPHPEALVTLARLKRHDDYTYMHSVAVCALMVALARQLGMSEDQAREAGMAGLLHDVGKAALPLAVLNKPGKLTEEEFGLVRDHPSRGHAMLSAGDRAATPWITDGVLDVCLHHHEKVDGTGYPHRISGEQLSLLARMGSICDVYDAITSTRPYKAAWDPSESIGKMASWRKGHFDESIFQAFVRSIGIYPVGSLVRMQSGRLGVVLENNADSVTTPKVKVFFSTKSNMPIAPTVLDLSSPSCTDRIAGRESNSNWKFAHLDAMWAPEQALKKLGR